MSVGCRLDRTGLFREIQMIVKLKLATTSYFENKVHRPAVKFFAQITGFVLNAFRCVQGKTISRFNIHFKAKNATTSLNSWSCSTVIDFNAWFIIFFLLY